jgi:hypothetical protein
MMRSSREKKNREETLTKETLTNLTEGNTGLQLTDSTTQRQPN